MAFDKLDGERCAVLVIDFTTGIVDTYATWGRAAAANAAALCEAARKAGATNIFVVPAHIGPDGTPILRTGELMETLRPHGNDRLLYKSKIGAFTTSGLDVVLREARCDTLLVTGIATSGTVLSTVRQGYDLGYRMVVVEDSCSDPEDAVHALLTKPVYEKSWIGLWRIAQIVTTDQAIDALRSSN